MDQWVEPGPSSQRRGAGAGQQVSRGGAQVDPQPSLLTTVCFGALGAVENEESPQPRAP